MPGLSLFVLRVDWQCGVKVDLEEESVHFYKCFETNFKEEHAVYNY